MKYPSYLSYSSLSEFEVRPYTFYLTRMQEPLLEREPQGLAAAMGSAFDVYIKTMLAVERNEIATLFRRILADAREPEKYKDMSFVDAFYQMSVEEQHREAVRQHGVLLAKQYYDTPLCKGTKWFDFERHETFILYGPYNVPLYMKLDAAVDLGLKLPCPLDWKVKGYCTDTSPTAGYKYLYDSSGLTTTPHERYKPDMSMDSIDIKWAGQLATYGWGLGWPLGEPFLAVIDSPCKRSGKWRIARYEAWITEEFQLKLAFRYREAWCKITTNEFSNGLNKNMAETLARLEDWYD